MANGARQQLEQLPCNRLFARLHETSCSLKQVLLPTPRSSMFFQGTTTLWRCSPIVRSIRTGDLSWSTRRPSTRSTCYRSMSFDRMQATPLAARGTSETWMGRKSCGILVAVTPCLRMVDLRPMYAAESLNQVLLFVHSIMQFLIFSHCATYPVRLCASDMIRHRRAQLRALHEGPEAAEWERMLSLRWIVDKLHSCIGARTRAARSLLRRCMSLTATRTAVACKPSFFACLQPRGFLSHDIGWKTL